LKRVIFLLAFAACVFAAEEHGGGHGPANLDAWKWANFALLVGLLGYLIYKKGGAFFAGRTASIRKDLDESARIKAEAEARYAEVEGRLARLDAEVASLRGQAQSESKAEGERVRQQTGRDMAKIRAQAEQDIATAAKAARQDLRAYAAELAVSLAEQKIRARLTPEADAALVAGVARDLRHEARLS
jgi:F-type H+-transporting ATPase subunit b